MQSPGQREVIKRPLLCTPAFPPAPPPQHAAPRNPFLIELLELLELEHAEGETPPPPRPRPSQATMAPSLSLMASRCIHLED